MADQDSTANAGAKAALEKLGTELKARDFLIHLSVPDGKLPFLTVRNPREGRLTEMILADGGFYWWSWADKVAPVSDVTGAANAVAQVLALEPGTRK
jgi:hypothetical protein